jgi:hypothetical protein
LLKSDIYPTEIVHSFCRREQVLIWRDIIAGGLVKIHLSICKPNVHAMIHSHKSVEFWRLDTYSYECSFDMSSRDRTWVTRFWHKRPTTTITDFEQAALQIQPRVPLFSNWSPYLFGSVLFSPVS